MNSIYFFVDITEYDEPYEGEASQSASSFSSGRKVPTKSVKRKPKPLIQYVSPEEEQISKIAQDIDIKREYVIDPKKPFMCTYCGVGFAREKALTAHIKVGHCINSIFYLITAMF